MKLSEKTAQVRTNQVNPYTSFSGLYDGFMEHVPFEKWSRYLLSVMTEYSGMLPPSICDLGCGTGQILYYMKPFIKKLYGLDGNAGMLSRARKRVPGGRFQQGRLEGPFPYKKNQFQWVICTHDSLNYLIREEDLLSHLKETARIMKPGGLYSTDIVTLQNILRNFNGRTRKHTVGKKTFLWSNQYNRKTKIMLSRLEFYSEREKIIEEHLQRYYTAAEVVKTAALAGFSLYLTQGDYESGRNTKGSVLTNLHFIRES